MSEVDFTPTEKIVETRNGEDWVIVSVQDAKKNLKREFCFRVVGDIGKGTFGIVKRIITPEGELCAMKRLDYDPRYKNREVSIMRNLDHTNCCSLFYYFVERDKLSPDLKVNLIMELMPTCLSSILAQHRRNKTFLPLLHVRLYLYQLLRGVAYLHLEETAHRDIKPQNILIDDSTAQLKICDFGSAKQLKEGEPNIAYICSRFYRAPELILGNCKYDCSVDMWAIGCVFAELFLLRPVFLGESSLDQFTEIIRILGTPTPEQMDRLHPRFPKDLKKRDPVCLRRHLKRANTQAICLLTKLLHYAPDRRIPCWDALAETYFDELREPGLTMDDGKPLPPLFDFTARELEQNPILNQLLKPFDPVSLKKTRTIKTVTRKTNRESWSI